MDEDAVRAADPFTITDLVDWVVRLFFVPGDAVLGLLINHAPQVARFLELGREDYGGTLSILISIMAWLALLLVLGTVANLIRNIDRKLTAGASEHYKESRRRLRVAARLFASRREKKKADREGRT